MSYPRDYPTNSLYADEQRLLLVEAAYNLVLEGGLQAIKTRDVAARAGMTVAGLHYYFTSKGLLLNGIIGYLEERLGLLESEVEEQPSKALCRAFERHQSAMQKTPELYLVLFEFYRRAYSKDEIRSLTERLDGTWKGHFEAIVHKGVEQKIFRADAPPALIATALVSLVKGQVLALGGIENALADPQLYSTLDAWLIGQTKDVSLLPLLSVLEEVFAMPHKL